MKPPLNFRVHLAAAAMTLLAACNSTAALAPTPSLYAGASGYSEAEIPAGLRTTTGEILYFTDRSLVRTASGQGYGLGRSSSMAFGTASVAFDGVSDWAALKRLSETLDRASKVELKIKRVEERVRFAPSTLPFTRVFGAPTSVSTEEHAYRMQQAAVQQVLRTGLQQASRKDVVLFVPGVNNTFEEGAQSLVNLWHFAERVGVPVLYSWPSGNPGLTGYFRDSEAAEFSIYHFKQVIDTVARLPEVDRIHIIAHSRGANLVASALREMIIAERERGDDPRRTLKITNLIMAAPDLDFGIVQQRLIAERFGPAFGRVTVYMNPDDGVLRLTQKLASGTRFGRLTPEDLTVSDRRILAGAGNVSFVDVAGINRGLGHSYFRDNPGVMSDIALTITRNAAPGTRDRPLRNSAGNFWVLDETYPF